MIAKTYSAIPYGYEGRIVEVEGDMNKGLPSFNIVGMANKTVNEAKDRVRSAITNSGFSFPGLVSSNLRLQRPLLLSARPKFKQMDLA